MPHACTRLFQHAGIVVPLRDFHGADGTRTGVPFLFQRLPLISAPFPVRSSAPWSGVSAAIRQSTLLERRLRSPSSRSDWRRFPGQAAYPSGLLVFFYQALRPQGRADCRHGWKLQCWFAKIQSGHRLHHTGSHASQNIFYQDQRADSAANHAGARHRDGRCRSRCLER